MHRIKRWRSERPRRPVEGISGDGSMTLRTKIGLIIGVTLLALILVVYESAHTILLSGFVDSETQSAQRDIARAADGLSDQLAALNLLAGDYAGWDDTYAFMIDHHPRYIEANMIDATFSQQQLNLLALINLSGEVVYGKSFDLQTGIAVPVPASLAAQFSPDSVLLQHADSTHSVTGIVVLPEGPLLVAAWPILTSHFDGPAHGTLIMGRYLDGNAVSQLARTTHLALSLHSIDDPSLPPDARAALLNSSPDRPMVTRPTDDQTIAGYALLKDVDGRSALVLQADIARDIYQHGQTATNYFMLWLMGILIAAGGVAHMLASRLIRSQQMRAQAEHEIRALNEDLEQRVGERTAQLETINRELEREIFERARAEDALRDSESLYHSLVEILPQSLCRKDRAGRFTFANGRYCEGMNRTLDEIVGKTDFDFHPAELAEKYRRDDRQVVETGEILDTVEEHRTLDGPPTFVHVVKSPIRNPHGQVIGAQIMFWDVTDQWRAEEALRLSEARLRQIIDLVPHFIFAKDIDGKFLLVNRATAEVYGTTVEALLNQTDADFAQSAEEAQRFRVDDLAVIDSQRPKVIFEEQITDARGQLHLLHTTKIPFTFSGSATPAILGVSVDITDRIAAETALRDSEERFRQLAENIHEVFWMTSPDRERVLYISPGYEEIWGRTCASVYANPASLIGAVHPDDRGRAADYFERQRRGESAFAEYRIIRPDNTIGWIWDRAFPIRNQLGEVYRMAGIAEDVTDRKQTEEGLQRALAKEKELGELKSRFISMASHEFRTPLTAILSSAEMLDRYSHKLTAERKQHHLLQIQASVKNMTRLLEDVLVIGKAEAGKLEFTPGLLDLEQFCCSLVDELQLGAGTRHRLTLIQRAPCRAVTMDAKLLRQILTNLLSNAIKYSPAGGSIELEVTCQGHEAVFRIADQGIGIPLAAHAHLFETFHRADNVGSIPGTGLGMAIVKNSVDLHRGTIEFSSEVGVGTVFVVRLPAQCDAPLLEANGS